MPPRDCRSASATPGCSTCASGRSGPSMTGTARCPECGARARAAGRRRAARLSPGGRAAHDPEELRGGRTRACGSASRTARTWPPRARTASIDDARAVLVRRCVIDATRGDHAVDPRRTAGERRRASRSRDGRARPPGRRRLRDDLSGLRARVGERVRRRRCSCGPRSTAGRGGCWSTSPPWRRRSGGREPDVLRLAPARRRRLSGAGRAMTGFLTRLATRSLAAAPAGPDAGARVCCRGPSRRSNRGRSRLRWCRPLDGAELRELTEEVEPAGRQRDRARARGPRADRSATRRRRGGPEPAVRMQAAHARGQDDGGPLPSRPRESCPAPPRARHRAADGDDVVRSPRRGGRAPRSRRSPARGGARAAQVAARPAERRHRSRRSPRQDPPDASRPTRGARADPSPTGSASAAASASARRRASFARRAGRARARRPMRSRAGRRRRRSGSGTARQGPEPRAPSEPAVQVTIGRVDIRAGARAGAVAGARRGRAHAPAPSSLATTWNHAAPRRRR